MPSHYCPPANPLWRTTSTPLRISSSSQERLLKPPSPAPISYKKRFVILRGGCEQPLPPRREESVILFGPAEARRREWTEPGQGFRARFLQALGQGTEPGIQVAELKEQQERDHPVDAQIQRVQIHRREIEAHQDLDHGQDSNPNAILLGFPISAHPFH